MHKAYKYRIYPTKSQIVKLNHTLEECRWLYNRFLEERSTAWEKEKKSISMYEQYNRVVKLKEGRPSLGTIYSQVLRNAGTRIDLAFKAFFRRCREGDKPGFPRFRGFGWYDSFTYPQSNGAFKIVNEKKIRLAGIGIVDVHLHRFPEGKMKNCIVKRAPTGKWFVSISCDEVPAEVFPKSDLQVGVDLGLNTFAVLSDGDKIENPRFFRKEEKDLARIQKKLEKSKRGSPERTVVRKAVSKVHERIKNKRSDFCHKESRKIVEKYGTIFVEDLSIRNMGKNRGLAKSIGDAAWGQFLRNLSYKAESAGRTFLKVNPAYTTQDCSNCGTRQVMRLQDRTYTCKSCGMVMDRDLNAAKNILGVGLYALPAKTG